MPFDRKTQARRYGRRHRRIRAYWLPYVTEGRVDCARCGQRIHPTDPWDLGHRDDGTEGYWGPEHSRCNRAAGARNSNITPTDPKPRRYTRW